MTATVSLLGLYTADETLFNNFNIPDEMEIETLRDNLLAETAELEILYSNPTVMKALIGVWSAKELPVWQRIYNASVVEYNPIENYDRNEDITDTGSGSVIGSGSDQVGVIRSSTDGGTESSLSSHSTTDSGTETTTHSYDDLETTTSTNSGQDQVSGSNSETNSGTDTTTNKNNAFNASSLYDHDSSSTAYGHGISSTSSQTTTLGSKNVTSVTRDNEDDDTTTFGKVVTESGTASTTFGKTNTENTNQTTTYGKHESTSNSNHRVSHIHGNIGVTTSQQMLESELEIAGKLNPYDYIIKSFIKRFCLLVY